MSRTVLVLSRPLRTLAVWALFLTLTLARPGAAVGPVDGPAGDGAGRADHHWNARKHAVLIGINAYPHVQRLQGCVNDVENLSFLLMRDFAFPQENVVRLTDAEATRNGILEAIARAEARVSRGDLFVFAYSGHGTVFPDRLSEEVDETREIQSEYVPEKGFYDSAICPYDSGGPSTSGKPWKNLILDDELFARFQRFTAKGVFVVLISDSCHSGTLGRTFDLDPDPPLARITDMRSALGVGSIDEISPPLDQRRGETRDLGGLYLTITSSSDAQVSWEHKDDAGKKCGLFSYAFRHAVEKARRSGKVSFPAIFDEARREVVAISKGDQEPQLDRRFFTGDLGGLTAFSPVEPADPSPSAALRVVVKVADTSGTPLEGALFCVLKPGHGADGQIRKEDTLLLGMTDAKGLFDSSKKGVSLQKQTYLLKVVKEGYVSFVGEREVVSSKADAGMAILSIKLKKED